MIDPRTPVLVGAGQFTQRTAQEKTFAASEDPSRLMARAARAALADAKASGDLAAAIDTVAVVRFTLHSPGARPVPFAEITNPPASLAKRMGLAPRRALYTPTGGNSPQALVSRTAEEIANGACDVALLAGCEDLASILGAVKAGVALDWAEDLGPPDEIGPDRDGVTDVERRHGLALPVNAYPLFENAIAHARGRRIEDHMAAMGRLMAPFSAVAAKNPHSWFPVERSAEEIATPGPANRFVGYPYTKYMNAVIEVDMAAALVMMSVQKARELGVPQDRWVFLHGCAEAHDHWYLSERVNFHASPAIASVVRHTFDMAGRTLADLDFIDLYSCFPSAVELACDALGLAEDDPRGLTVTGGLPYFGGAGNNYVMHAIASLMDLLRAKPGSFGLSTANGYYVTKHAAGIYSTVPVEGPWSRGDTGAAQREVDETPKTPVEETPEGRGTIETFTVAHDRDGPRNAIVMARTVEGRRFVASSAKGDLATCERLMAGDPTGAEITVSMVDGKAVFSLGG